MINSKNKSSIYIYNIMSWLFQNTKQSSQSSQQPSSQAQKIQLPPEFAQNLLNLELEIELPTVSLDTITKLLELYGIGVEYFSTFSSDKYLVFMNKCQSLLLRPNVAALLNNEETKTNVQKAKEMQNSLSSFANKESIQKFLAAEREIQLKMNAIIQNDIQSQEDRLAQRKLKRQQIKIKSQNEDLLGIENLDPDQDQEQNSDQVPNVDLNQDPDEFENYVSINQEDNLLDQQNNLEEPSTITNDLFNQHDWNLLAQNSIVGNDLPSSDSLPKQEYNSDNLVQTKDLLDLSPQKMQTNDPIDVSPKNNSPSKSEKNYQDKFKETLLTQAKSLQQMFSNLGKKEPQSNNSPSIQIKEKKIREMVNRNKTLAKQKSELLEQNKMLPF